MKKKSIFIISGLIIVLVIALLLLRGNTDSQFVYNCPDTELYDFDQKVESKEDAIRLFKEYFSEENGYTPFDESEVMSPDEIQDRYMKDFYIYNNMYGFISSSEKGSYRVGGVLDKNGRLFKKISQSRCSYCG